MTNPFFKPAITQEVAEKACISFGWKLEKYAGVARKPSLVSCLRCGNVDTISLTAIKQGRRCSVCRGHGEGNCPLVDKEDFTPEPVIEQLIPSVSQHIDDYEHPIYQIMREIKEASARAHGATLELEARRREIAETISEIKAAQCLIQKELEKVDEWEKKYKQEDTEDVLNYKPLTQRGTPVPVLG